MHACAAWNCFFPLGLDAQPSTSTGPNSQSASILLARNCSCSFSLFAGPDTDCVFALCMHHDDGSNQHQAQTRDHFNIGPRRMPVSRMIPLDLGAA